jgi:hypothetical protein
MEGRMAMNIRVPAGAPAVAFCLLVLTGGLVGADEKLEQSRFAGEYSGSFRFLASDSRFSNQTGTVTLAISSAGKVRGVIKNATVHEAADVTGAVDNDGALEYIVEFAKQAYVLKGTVTKTRKGHLKGTLTQFFGTEQAVGSVDFDLPPK